MQRTTGTAPLVVLAVSLSLASDAIAQTTAPGGTRGPRDERAKTVVTATRGARNPLVVPRSFDVYDADDMQLVRQVRTLPEALRETPGVSVQKTGHGQGSPKMRGLTGFHTLLLVDGIRVNNSTWRSGNVEYWNTVDPLSAERLEIVRGPSSVLWGSEAVAGTGQILTRGPGKLEPGTHTRTTALFRYASAEQSFTERLEYAGNVDHFGWHAGVSYKDFGELVGGKTIGEMPHTAYRELDGDAKLVFDAENAGRFTVAFQHANPMEAPRTHATVFSKPWRGIVPGSDFLRDIDQERDLVYARWSRGDDGDLLFDLFSAELTVAYQRFREEENRVRSNSRRTIQGVDVDQVGLLGRFTAAVREGWLLTFGFDTYYEDVGSRSTEYEASGAIRSVAPRGAVADDASYTQLGFYAQLEAALDSQQPKGSERWLATLGVRASYVAADADIVDPDPTDATPFGPIDRSWNSVVGAGSLLHRVSDDVSVFGHIAQSFRAPNLSDLTRFDVALSGDQEIPSPSVDPEKFLTFELGARADTGLRRASATAFYTIAQDLIERRPTGNIVGGNVEVTKDNVSDGFFVGFEAEAATRLDFISVNGTSLDALEVYGFVDFVHAVVDAADPADPRRTHPKGLPPAKGQVGVRWYDLLEDRYGVEVFVPFTDRVAAHDYNAAEARNNQRIPPGGLPGWATLGARGWVRLLDNVTASLAIENITNKDYRIFDSGLNEPGTNVIFTLRADI